MKRFLYSLPLIVVLLLGGFAVWGLLSDRDPNAVPSVLIAKPVPDFDLPAIEGMVGPGFSTADLQGLKMPAIVNIFASWCVPCRAEHPILTALAEREGVLVFGINYKDRPDAALGWLEELGNPYTRIGSDYSGRAAIEWGVTGVPESFVIAPGGEVVYRFSGPIVGADAQSKITAALAEAWTRTGLQ